MPRIRTAAPLGLALLLAGGAAVTLRAAAQTTDAGSSLREAIAEANRELERRFRAGDMTGVAAMYADNAVLLGPGGYRVEGREAIDAYWARIAEPVDWSLEVFEVRGGRGIAHQLGRSTLVVGDPESDEARTSVVDFAVVWSLENGSWRIVVDAYWPKSD